MARPAGRRPPGRVGAAPQPGSPTEPDVPDAPFETVLDPTGDGGDAMDGAVLRVAVAEREGELSLRLAYRTDALDADSAARIAGYHVRPSA